MTCKKTEMYVCIVQRLHSSLCECNVVPAILIEIRVDGGKPPVCRMPVQHGLSPSLTPLGGVSNASVLQVYFFSYTLLPTAQ